MRYLPLLVLLAACAAVSGDGPPTGQDSTTAEPVPTPFAPQADVSEGLVNVSADLDAILEYGALQGACDAWQADPGNRRKKLMCGKSMFFYEGFGTIGMPSVLLDFVGTRFEEQIGLAFEGYGMVPDPTVPGRPIGVGAGAPFDTVETLAFTCAACHFGPLPDGRFAVGAPNHGYEYATHMMALTLVPSAANPLFNREDHHPDAVALVEPLLDRIQGDLIMQMDLGIQLLPLLGSSAPTISYETEGQYASWPSGTMDFAIAPLPIDDEVHTVSKFSALYGIPTHQEMADAQMHHAMLAWTGNGKSVEDFLQGFVAIGGGDSATWTPERMEPLAEYIYSLRAPTPPAQPADKVAEGEEVFFSSGCIDCHSGPRGSGLRKYDFEEIGTDGAMMAWGDPDLDGIPCCGMDSNMADDFTHQLKSPRLVGLWAMERFLHNGAVDSIESLLCMEGPRPTVSVEPLSDKGHTFGCDLPVEDRVALATFLRSL